MHTVTWQGEVDGVQRLGRAQDAVISFSMTIFQLQHVRLTVLKVDPLLGEHASELWEVACVASLRCVQPFEQAKHHVSHRGEFPCAYTCGGKGRRLVTIPCHDISA